MAMSPKAYHVLAGLFAGLLCACSNTKYLPAGETLYTGVIIKIDSSSLGHQENKKIASSLSPQTRPTPNSKILGLRVKLYVYNLAGHPKKRKSLGGWLKYKIGEPPVLASSVDLDRNGKVLQSYIQNKGYFQSEVDGDTVTRNRKTQAVFHVQPGTQYKIDSVAFLQDSSAVDAMIAEDFSKTFLKKGQPFDLDVIKAERIRIDAALKEKGVYFFSPDFLIVDADSSLRSHHVDLFVKTKHGLPAETGRAYHIRDVYIFANYSLKSSGADTSHSKSVSFKNFYLVDTGSLFKPFLFDEAMRFKPGDLYSRNSQNLTVSRLVNLGVFKFVKNRLEVAKGTDSPMLNAYYYLTPLPKRSLHAEVYGTTKSDNLIGSELTAGWVDRNVFRGGELLSISAYGGFEVQFSSTEQGYDIYRLGVDNKLSFPRFIVPFIKLNTRGAFVPKTNVDIGYDFINKIRLYTLNSFHGSFGYDWKESAKKEHEFNPIAITYVQPLNVTQEYKDSAVDNPTLLLVIQKQFILGSNYTFTYNQLVGPQPRNAIFFRGNLDFSGNIAGLLTGADTKANKTVDLFGLDFAQYIRAETDFRYYYKSGTTVWANRIDMGFGLPYGNSTALPFVKQFFVGGTNSVRAFRSMSVGPGIYISPSNTTFLPEETGDIKLEMNTELRAKLFSIVNGAIFVDAGNVWLYNNDTTRPGSKFTGDFLQQLAVGTGVGLRFDVSILVIRLDLAFPLRKPYLPPGERWVFNQIDFGSSTWRANNLVLNLGIGYPF